MTGDDAVWLTVYAVIPGEPWHYAYHSAIFPPHPRILALWVEDLTETLREFVGETFDVTKILWTAGVPVLMTPESFGEVPG